ncbi:phloretin 4'-O-glucosyltransferase-like [Pyrus x bretschneideri]|uniref:phloretin 4'-O-glucosyltransferase-like n=1 Tax=Pyrus x bretschneideri TaxID=225117 RepID=UPI00202F510A|nr:phloretin 4'-O-glucosyltransferase-like [Pyrus x bretschneideri]
MVQHRFLLVTYPAQGHINPSFQFAKRLINTTGAQVTFVTCLSASHRVGNDSIPDGLTYALFSDGYDDGFKPGDNIDHYMSELRRRGAQAITDLVVSSANEGHPYTCLVCTILLPWAANVAHELHLPNVLLWIQPATVFDIYYYYFNGYKDLIRDNTGSGTNDALPCSIQLPGLPLSLTSRDLPSFMVDTNPYTFALPLFQEQMDLLERETHPTILVNTFDALEPEALKAIEKYNLIGVGPLIPTTFLDAKDPSDKSFGGDLFQKSKDSPYLEWLNLKPEGSVIYVSFGSICVLEKAQMEEIAKGLLDCGRPFLWVIKDKVHKKGEDNEVTEEEEMLSCREELEELGKIVPWCSQVEVLSSPSLGCFVTHCGWNSSLESLASGVPVVAFPQWTDQGTNAKLIEDTWKTGARVTPNEKGIVTGEELKRCLELVMGSGEIGEEMRRNAKKWKDLAREAVSEGGSSDKNLKAFLDQID